jgi:hypothetical protein
MRRPRARVQAAGKMDRANPFDSSGAFVNATTGGIRDGVDPGDTVKSSGQTRTSRHSQRAILMLGR